MICWYKICVLQLQPRKDFLDHADYTAPTRQHEVLIRTYQESTYLPCLADLDREL